MGRESQNCPCIKIMPDPFGRQSDRTVRALSPRQVADLLGHSTSQITELCYVKKDGARQNGITKGFEI